MKNRIITALAAILAIPAMAAPAGYFQVPGTETTMKIYGKAETWGVYGLNGFENVTEFDGSHANANRTGTVDSFTYARLGVTTTTPSAYGDVNVKVEYQAQSGAGVANGGASYKASTNTYTKGSSLNLRHAYGEFAGVLIGQTDSLFSAWHNSPGYLDNLVADFDGTGRTRQIRYTLAPAKGVQVGFSVEQDRTGGNSTKIVPQLVVAGSYGADWGSVVASLGYAKKENWTLTNTTSGTGTSFALSGSFNLGANDSFTAMIENGGGFYGIDNTDGFVQVGNDFKFYKTMNYTLGYSHVWSPAFTTNAGLGQINWKKDVTLGVPQKFTMTEFFLNTTWQVTKNAKFGAEWKMEQLKASDTAIWTKKDGSTSKSNADNRIKLMFQYMFF